MGGWTGLNGWIMGFSVVYERVGTPEALVMVCFDDLDLGLGTADEVKAAVLRKEFEGGIGQIAEAFPLSGPRVFVVGLGSREGVSADAFRTAGKSLASRLQAAKIESAHFDASGFDAGEGMGLALGLATFSERAFAGTASNGGEDFVLRVAGLDEGFDRGLERGLGLSAGVNECRRLVNTPPNMATPGWMAEQARGLAESTGLGVDVWEGDRLDAERLTGLMTVGKASENRPCLIRLEWRPAGTEGMAPVVLLGKTITYDTGGLSIKSKTGMPGMKYDKSGGCAVFGAMHAVATVLKPDFPVVGLLVAAENSISNNAYRPDDVMTYRNGVTVEVTNTDAEGRLVLADGLCWAEEVEKARAVVDIATLTGGVVTALGSVYAGVFSRHDALLDGLGAAGERSGELLWELPLHERYEKMMESKVADLVNSVPGGSAHPVQGATFLSKFVSPETPWAHIDMAGVGRSKGDGVTDEGPSGFGVRLFVEWLAAGAPGARSV